MELPRLPYIALILHFKGFIVKLYLICHLIICKLIKNHNRHEGYSEQYYMYLKRAWGLFHKAMVVRPF